MYCALSTPGQDMSIVDADSELLSGVSVPMSELRRHVSFAGRYETLWQSGVSPQ
jgi:hypothetical protein